MSDQVQMSTPVTADTPMEESSVLKSIGAQVIGSEELESKIKDVEYMLQADVQLGDKVRTTESKGFFKRFLDKIASKKQASQIQEK